MADSLRDLVIGCQRHSVTDNRYKNIMIEKIGNRVKRWRLKRDLTVAELARDSGIAATTLYDLERGISTSTTKLHKIAKNLRISVEYLETGKGDPETGLLPIQDVQPKETWPFRISKIRYDRLADREKEAIDEMLEAYISHREVAREKRPGKSKAG